MRRGRTIGFAAIGLSLFTGYAVSAAPIDDARAAYLRGDNVTAVQLLRPLAEAGNVEAQFYLGGMYDYGLGVPKDIAQALNWYRKAAEKGFVGAQVNLGSKYQSGEGVPRSMEQAIKWFRLAANQGNAIAQYDLAIALSAPSVAEIGEALKWFLLAADQGNAAAQYELGVIYSSGRGTPRDNVQAYKWWTLSLQKLPASQTQMRGLATTGLKRISSAMTAKEIADATKSAREWKASPPCHTVQACR